MTEIKKLLLIEKSEETKLIRQIVRDIITVFKSNDEGEFYLPEDLPNNDEEHMEYFSPKTSVSVELTIEELSDLDNFLVNAYFARNENVIEVKIVYNPKNKTTMLYDLVGELNEVIAHEMRHLYQKETGMFYFSDEEDEEELPPFEYYSDPKEVDAQVAGFRRMKNVTKRPFETLVRNWFSTHTEIHNLNKEEQEEIIQMILDRNSKI